MKRILLTPIKNEEGIVRPFIEHHLKYFDLIIIADQFSSDSSWDIINRYSNVISIRNTAPQWTDQWNEGATKNLLYETALAYGNNNLLFHLDADEFLLVSEDKWHAFCSSLAIETAESLNFSFDWIFLRPDRLSAIIKKNVIFACLGSPRYWGENDNLHLSRFNSAQKTKYVTDISILHINLLWSKRQTIKCYYYMAVELLQKGGLCMRQRRTLYEYAYGLFGQSISLDGLYQANIDSILTNIIISDVFETWHYKELCLILSDPSKASSLHTLPIWGFPWRTEASLACYSHIPELSLSGFIIQFWLTATRRHAKGYIVRAVEKLIDQFPPFREDKRGTKPVC